MIVHAYAKLASLISLQTHQSLQQTLMGLHGVEGD